MAAPLRIVIVHDIHPMQKHVSANRMRRVADVLAALGDHVLTLTPPLSDDDDDIEQLSPRINGHDWALPLRVTCTFADMPMLHNARRGKLIPVLRHAVLAHAQLYRGGVFEDWYRGAATIKDAIAEAFKPDVVLATFGNTANWSIAQALARQAKCPWVGDMKDNWDVFIHSGFRRILAKRFYDMAQMTTYSSSHSVMANKWFSQRKTVVYSGFPDQTTGSLRHNEPLGEHILLSGSLYHDTHLQAFIDGLEACWAPGPKVKLLYAGNDTERFTRATTHIASRFDVEALGFIEHGQYVALAEQSICNAYIVNPASLFQQKLLELLAAQRPILTVPEESFEATRIIEDVGGTLHACKDAPSVTTALDCIRSTEYAAPDQSMIAPYSVSSQVAILRNVLADATGCAS